MTAPDDVTGSTHAGRDESGRDESGRDESARRESARRTRRSFLVGAAATAAGYGLWRAVQAGRQVGYQPPALRRAFEADAAVSRAVFGDERGLAPTYPLAQATELRVNGNAGLVQSLDLDSWRLQLAGSSAGAGHPRFVADVTAWTYRYAGDMQTEAAVNDVKTAAGAHGGPNAQKSRDTGSKAPAPSVSAAPVSAANTLNPTGAQDSDAGAALAARIEALTRGMAGKPHQGNGDAGPSASGLDRHTPGLLLTLSDLQALPFVEQVTQFKCIEGWSQVVHWGGYRLRDFLDAYPPAPVDGPSGRRDPRFVYMETPDGDFYGGYDLSAARHPQSLLVTHMHGQPLTQQHGAPLRLFMPIKYGYKNLKRIGLIRYMDTKPEDYWAKLGYDWYAGL